MAPAAAAGAYFAGLIQASDQKTRFSFLVVHRSTGRSIGYVKLQIDVARRIQIPTVVLGEREFWGVKLGSEAVRAVQNFAFGFLPVDRIESRVYAENEPVRNRLLRSGHRETTVCREVTPDGQERTVHVYCIERDAWRSLSASIEARLATQPDVPPSLENRHRGPR